ncbi:MAG: phosphoribosylglycinamide synthetase C domain-containing protein, partial [Catalinimonas sp.]
MGAVSPVPFADEAFLQKVDERVVKPTLAGLRADGIDYRGFIFIGLMNVAGDPHVIEYNVRLGDPEAEVVLPRLDNDLLDLFDAVREQRLDEVELIADTRTAATVVLTSGGYPGPYEKGRAISGIDEADDDALIFHAGTRLDEGQLVTNGGRVVAVTALGRGVKEATRAAQQAAEAVRFEGKQLRRDIGDDLLD